MMLKAILIVLGLAVIALIVVVAIQPSEFRIQRSATISAPPATIFPHVNEPRKWEAWSPFAKRDPNAKHTYEGPASGVGSKMSWEGNKEMGVGTMTVTDSRPSESVAFLLEFKKPFEANNNADFTFKPEGAETVVTWGMSGKNNFMFKAVGLFLNMDKMLGADFERGLADLKKIAETETKK